MPVKAIIDLKRILYNAKEIKKRLPCGVKFCAVVKADGYGHGAEKVANTLYNFVDCFAVATVEEGVRLRFSGIDKDILVLSGVEDSELAQAVGYSLTLTAGSLYDLKRYAKEGERQGVRVKTHIKFDTGMHRQGVNDIDELKIAFAFGKNNGHLDLCGLYSHFARPENDRSRTQAVKKFNAAKNAVKEYDGTTFHISASGGFIKGEYFDMVRIGILLYGYKPFKTDKIKVKPAMKVYAPVIKTERLRRGECALYGGKRVGYDTDLTLIRYGYADGLFRKEIEGQFNNRCMDITAINGRVRQKAVAVMTDADSVAKEYGTISYEILVKCALRAEKIYSF